MTLPLGQELQLSLGALVKQPSCCIIAENWQRYVHCVAFLPSASLNTPSNTHGVNLIYTHGKLAIQKASVSEIHIKGGLLGRSSVMFTGQVSRQWASKAMHAENTNSQSEATRDLDMGPITLSLDAERTP